MHIVVDVEDNPSCRRYCWKSCWLQGWWDASDFSPGGESLSHLLARYGVAKRDFDAAKYSYMNCHNRGNDSIVNLHFDPPLNPTSFRPQREDHHVKFIEGALLTSLYTVLDKHKSRWLVPLTLDLNAHIYHHPLWKIKTTIKCISAFQSLISYAIQCHWSFGNGSSVSWKVVPA